MAAAGRALRILTFAADAAAAVAALLVLGVADGRLGAVLVPLLAGAWLLLLRRWGGYRRGLGYSLGAEARSIILTGLSGGLFVLALGPELGLRSRPGATVALAASIASFALGRILLRAGGRILRRRGALVRRALLVGHGQDARELLENIEAWPSLGIQVVGACADTDAPAIRDVPVLGRARSCRLVARDLDVRTVFLAPASLSTETCLRIHSELANSDLELILTPNAPHVEIGRLSTRQLGGLPVLRFERQGQRPRAAAKRVLDVVAAGTLLALLALPFFAIALLVRCDSRGPAFFRQRRVGKGGALFTLWKFRTMRADAESLLAQVQAESGQDRALFKLNDDPRVTRVGRWLRRTSLDELPQLWNVLLGHMSLVGPRPALPHETAEFDDVTLRRLRVKPGITGLWQVHGRADASFATYRRMDAFYAENWTLAADVEILLRTIPAVFGAKGAY